MSLSLRHLTYQAAMAARSDLTQPDLHSVKVKLAKEKRIGSSHSLLQLTTKYTVN